MQGHIEVGEERRYLQRLVPRRCLDGMEQMAIQPAPGFPRLDAIARIQPVSEGRFDDAIF
jgi:hypothetical protein